LYPYNQKAEEMSKGKILVVDDEPKIVKQARDYLEKGGFRVVTAADGEMALVVARHERPDLIVLDLNLPEMDGLDVCRALRRESDVPIIMLTARVEETDRLIGLELGADDYITKPFDMHELRLRVRNALSRGAQGSLTNPVTGLPEGTLVDEKLSEVVGKDGTSLLYISIQNMNVFRDAYGFVVSDDVLRALRLMIANTMHEMSRAEDFLGHLSSTDFVLLLPPSNLSALSEKLRERLDQSMEYFYPLKDRSQMLDSNLKLSAKIFEMTSLKNSSTDLTEFKAGLTGVKI